jgi:hypothetical protein
MNNNWMRHVTEKIDRGVEVVAETKPVLYNVNYKQEDAEVNNINDALALGKIKNANSIRKPEGKRNKRRNRFNKNTSYIERANREAMKDVRRPKPNHFFKKVNRH